MVMREALVLLGVGLAIGIPAALWLTRYLSLATIQRARPSDFGDGRGGTGDSGGGGGGRGTAAGAAGQRDRSDSGVAIRIKGEAR